MTFSLLDPYFLLNGLKYRQLVFLITDLKQPSDTNIHLFCHLAEKPNESESYLGNDHGKAICLTSILPICPKLFLKEMP